MRRQELVIEDQKSAPAQPRPQRSDARKNMELLINAAAAEFEEEGVDVPIHVIAKRAGMGVGTLYRHFPTRSDLIVAVFKNDVERCVSEISSIRSRFAPAEALTVWIESYVDFITARRGLAAAMNSLDPALINLPAYFQEKLGPLLQELLDDASVENSSKSDLRASEVLHAVAMLCVPSNCGEVSDPMRLVRTFIAGIKQ